MDAFRKKRKREGEVLLDSWLLAASRDHAAQESTATRTTTVARTQSGRAIKSSSLSEHPTAPARKRKTRVVQSDDVGHDQSTEQKQAGRDQSAEHKKAGHDKSTERKNAQAARQARHGNAKTQAKKRRLSAATDDDADGKSTPRKRTKHAVAEDKSQDTPNHGRNRNRKSPHESPDTPKKRDESLCRNAVSFRAGMSLVAFWFSWVAGLHLHTCQMPRNNATKWPSTRCTRAAPRPKKTGCRPLRSSAGSPWRGWSARGWSAPSATPATPASAAALGKGDPAAPLLNPLALNGVCVCRQPLVPHGDWLYFGEAEFDPASDSVPGNSVCFKKGKGTLRTLVLYKP